MANRRKGARTKLREYFEAHVGEVLNGRTLREVVETTEWARRVRELRNDEGMQILTHTDLADLRPGEYMLVSLERKPRISHSISAAMRARILDRNGYTCQSCGLGAGDENPLHPERRVTLHIDHIAPDGPSEDANLRVLCSACNEGRSNVLISQPTIRLMAQIRRASRQEQLEVYEWLKQKFGQ